MPEKWININGPWGITGKHAEYLTIAGIILASLIVLSFVAEYLIYRRAQNQAEAKNVLPYVIYSVLFLILWIEPTAYGVFFLSVFVFLYVGKNLISDAISALKQLKTDKKPE